jgi:LacI family transcriptional regulator
MVEGMKVKTIDDIAREAGVSKATVSRVLSHPELVRPKTQQRVQKVIDTYSYSPNHLAQGLAGTPTKTIGVVIDELSNFFFIEVAEGIDHILSDNQYSMLLCSSKWIEEEETRLVQSLIASRVDGVLLASIKPQSKSMELLTKANIPFVVLNCIPDDPSLSFVCCDNKKGGQLAALHINNNTREQIMIITGFDHQTIEDRLEGFNSRINSPDVIHYSQVETQQDGYDLVPTLIKERHIDTKTTFIFVTNDNVAIGIINALAKLHIPIPDQVAIIGYDNIRVSAISRVPLTTISQSITESGEIAATNLLKLITTKETTHTLIEPFLVQRESG